MERRLKKNDFLIARVGWMHLYQGYSKRDPITGGGWFVEEYGYGFEIQNFKEVDGNFYGYVEGTNQTIEITKIGARPGDQFVEKVTVVWVAKNPVDHITYVVGWYRNATVFRKPVISPLVPGRISPDKEVMSWNCRTDQDNQFLLAPGERSFEVRQGGYGWMSQSNVHYADRDIKRVEELRQDLLAYLAGHHRVSGKKKRGQISAPRQPDIELRLEIEQRAVRAVRRLYIAMGYQVKSVESQNRGWDLEANKAGKLLRIEVKGRRSGDINCELTPNEYSKMRQYKKSYRLCIVTDALKSRSSVHDFGYIASTDEWSDSHGHELSLRPRTGAIASAN